ncbi:MAG TPA: helix-turn-helix domain-containing protein [Saprospiraceae bacterium]|nr:helix-turn-helix domain-containing protein [Saprospiraceae bacterium]
MTKAEYKEKYIRMEELLTLLTEKGELSMALNKELDDISQEIAIYEENNFPFEVESLIEMIELRMYQRKLKQKDLAEILGTTPSRISEILNGKRQLNFELAKGLYSKLNIDPSFIFSE